MIVLFNGYGNHSNRLFQNLHFEAFCLKNNIQYCNSTFTDISKYYNQPVHSKKTNISRVLKTKPIRILRNLGLIKNIISYDNQKEEDIGILLDGNYKDIYVDGWGFRAYKETKELRDIFSLKYSLKEDYYKNNALLNIIQKYKEQGYSIVGIHVRRGDYSTFANGAYYFSDDIYKNIIDKVHHMVREKCRKEAKIIIFSNDVVDVKSDAMYSKSEWYIDHHLMTKCDLLIGPPSTFTLWASYLGKVPVFHVVDKDEDIKFDDFYVCNG